MFCLCPLNNKLDQELHLSSLKKKGQELHIEKLILSIFDLKKKESNSTPVARTNFVILYGL